LLLNGKHPNAPNSEADLQHGYFYLQEFLEGNEFDIRITIIGNRAFSFRRFNREGDFRASGSGLIDFDQNQIEKEAIILAKKVANRLKLPVVAVDLLKKNNEYVVCEYNVSFASFGIKKTPGYWKINEDFENGDIDWVVGNYDPADMIFNDFINKIF
jgi:glutathione synthase/RimK-type ligase-like ATP-grasp enzyme